MKTKKTTFIFVCIIFAATILSACGSSCNTRNGKFRNNNFSQVETQPSAELEKI